MSKEYKRTLITTALPYTNGPVHIGHLAGVYIPADIYARYLRLAGRPVTRIGGSDEHGVPITLKARKEGVTPQDIVDRYHKLIEQNKDNLNFYKMFAEIEFTLTNLVTTAQTYLFKFNEKTINNFIPSYKDLLNITTTQDLFIKFPLINNENGLSLYSQIFLEKQLENNVISSKEKIYNNTKAIITTELYKIYKIYKRNFSYI